MICYPALFGIWRNAVRTLPLIWHLSCHVLGSKRAFEKAFAMIGERNRQFTKEFFQAKEKTDLLLALVQDFARSALEQGSKPVFILTPYRDDLDDSLTQDGHLFYADFIAAARRIDGLYVIDPAEHLMSSGELDKLYVSDSYGGHLSAHGNQVLAGIIAEKINSTLAASPV